MEKSEYFYNESKPVGKWKFMWKWQTVLKHNNYDENVWEKKLND